MLSSSSCTTKRSPLGKDSTHSVTLAYLRDDARKSGRRVRSREALNYEAKRSGFKTEERRKKNKMINR